MDILTIIIYACALAVIGTFLFLLEYQESGANLQINLPIMKWLSFDEVRSYGCPNAWFACSILESFVANGWVEIQFVPDGFDEDNMRLADIAENPEDFFARDAEFFEYRLLVRLRRRREVKAPKRVDVTAIA